LSFEAPNEESRGILSAKISQVYYARKIVELLAFEMESLLVIEKVGIVQCRLVHELQHLRNEEDWQDYQVNLPSDSAVLSTALARLVCQCCFGVVERSAYIFVRDFEFKTFTVLFVTNGVCLSRNSQWFPDRELLRLSYSFLNAHLARLLIVIESLNMLRLAMLSY